VDMKEVCSVLYLAHKYNTQALFKRCSEQMKTGINLDSAIDIYQVANLLEQQDLKTHAFKFMSK